LEYCQRTFDIHLTALENSFIHRVLRRAGKPLLEARARAANWLLRSPLRKLVAGWLSADSRLYSEWVAQQTRQLLPALLGAPRFSILLRVSKPHQARLQQAVESVCAQSYKNWELCIAECPGLEARAREYLAAAAQSDSRIQLIPGVDESDSSALNQAAAHATGDYLAVLHPDARLDPDALHWLANEAPADVIYTDEDLLDQQGRPIKPVFKPDWSPDLLLSCMYIGHMMAVSRPAWERCGGFRREFDDAHDYDLALRIADSPAVIRHVPRILYHSLKQPTIPHDSNAARRALQDALNRRGAPAEVEDGPHPLLFQVHWKPRAVPASLIICSRSPHLLEQCLSSLANRTAYPHREVIVVQHLGWDDRALQAVIERHGAKRVPYAGPFDFSRMNNLGAHAATGEILVFLNDDVTPLEPSWLERLVAQTERPDVGIAGARLLYPSGALQHAGVAIGIGDGCGHIGRGALTPRYWPWVELTRDVAAVTGACLATRAALFHELDGFAEEFPVNYNDTDLCLRVRQAGYRVVYESGAMLRHTECQSRRGVVTLAERQRWYDRWAEFIEAGDPFYSPHLTREREDLSLRSVSDRAFP
jgi:GT2 family glycosyltransferase